MKALQVSVKCCSNVSIKALFLDVIEETLNISLVTLYQSQTRVKHIYDIFWTTLVQHFNTFGHMLLRPKYVNVRMFKNALPIHKMCRNVDAPLITVTSHERDGV